MSSKKTKAEILRAELEKEVARREYSSYCVYTHRGKWILGKHLKLICDEVENLIYRRIKENILIISLPPQHGKSQCVTETLPSYFLGKYPDKRVIITSYGEDLAKRFGRLNRLKINDFGRELFNVELDKETDTDFTLAGHDGSLISRGIMSGITGQPADLIIIDDVIKNRLEANSETYRNRIWDEFLNSVYTRLSADGVIVVIMTRWHEDDLAGKLLKAMPGKCREINIPLEAEENDILGRSIGDSLFPEIGKDNNWLKDFKRVFMTEEGSMVWNALMQGHPTCQEGNMIKRSWFKFYKDLPRLAKVVISIDATFKDSDTSDFVAMSVWGMIGSDIYLLDLINKRMNFPDTIKAIRYLKKKWRKASHIYIEDKANGSAIISVLRHELNGVIPVEPKGSKIARVSAISGCLEAGNVHLPEDGVFVYEGSTVTIHDFINQCASFPNSENDDMVDSMSQALNKLLYSYAAIPEAPHEDWEDMNKNERFEAARRQYTKNYTCQTLTDWSDY